MSESAIGIKIEFPQAVLDKFADDLKTLKKKAKKGIRRGVTKAGRVLRMAVKSRLPKESGLMRRRLQSVVRTYKSGAVVAVIGIAKGPAEMVRVKEVFRIIGGKVVRIKVPKVRQRMVKRNPAKVLHLIELGFTQPDGTHVPGQAPVRKGHAAVRPEMESIIGKEFKAEVES